MKCNKKMVAACVAAGMTVGAAVPALALENEFHGMFRSQFINSNFTGAPSTGGVDNDGTYAPAFGYGGNGPLPAKAPIANMFEQRARIYYLAKINDDLKVVTKFELDYSFWGNSSYTTKRNQGGALGADTVNLETKNVYVDYNVPSTPINVKVGMQGVSDAFKGIIFDADMAGVLASYSKDQLSGSVGFFRWNDKPVGTDTIGKKTRDIFALDTKYALDGAKVGASYYFLDNKLAGDNMGSGYGHWASVDNKKIHMLGVNAEGAVGPVNVDGFFVYQNGTLINRHLSAFAADGAASVKLGPGKAHVEALYVSGDKHGNGTSHGFVDAVAPLGGESDVDNGMVLLTRNKFDLTYATAIIYDVNNQDQGMIGGFVGYDMPLTSKLDASANAGFAAIAKANGNPNQGANSSDYLGTELNLEFAYKVNSNMKLTARGGYVFLGDYYKHVAANGETPDNPYDARLVLSITF